MAEGHRQRMKKRFVEEGLDNFEDHNALELLLFYAFPRIATNEIAHRLVDTFGSFANVFDAPYEELIKVEGIGESAATLIKLIPQISRKYINSRNSKTIMLNSNRDIGEFFIGKFFGMTNECVMLLMLNNKNEVIDCAKFYEGSVNCVPINIREMVKKAMYSPASSVAVAHNHPKGNPVPSMADKKVTEELIQAFKLLGIDFIDHFIIAENEYGTVIHSARI